MSISFHESTSPEDHSPEDHSPEDHSPEDHSPEDHSPEDHDDFGGLQRDLSGLVQRRRALQWMGGLGLAGVLAACSSSESTSSNATAASTSSTAATGSTASTTASGSTAAAATAGDVIPQETAGPYPADGSNGPNFLTEEGMVRTDITSSVGSLSGTAVGVPTTLALTVVDAATGSPLPGAAMYLWHCTADGKYSIYEEDDQNYLRGVQVADDSGKVTFTTIFPGCYAGRWPHCHFEVYESVDEATAGNQAISTSQLALPQADCETVYADARYGQSLSNLGRLSLTSDNVFRDGWESQLATVSGSADSTLTVSLLVRV